uniref:Uncharacterized protein n=1 Tax=Anguilla anguilla TaxID=7936 RepID=A0A0E9XVW2_ANGAN
MQPCGEHSK